MKLSNISVIFIIIVIPIILLLSYYISSQIDTINMQTAYTSKHLRATKEAIEAFEINTVEWNEAYSENADSKRRDIMASINTFTTSFANGIGVGGANKEIILTYIPAIATTLYDGYYIYTPSETKEVIKDKNGVAVFLTERIVKADNSPITEYTYKFEHEGRLLYVYDSSKGGSADGKYNGIEFTLNSDYAKSTYEHILKPFNTYSARYKNGDIDITINYTLDNYITIYGNIKNKETNQVEYIVKSGYLIKIRHDLEMYSEILTEKIWYKGLPEAKTYTYVYAEDNTKVYFDGGIAFQVSSTGVRTDLNDTTEVKYKKVRQNSWEVVYQALNNGSVERKNLNGEPEIVEIHQGNLYIDKKGREAENVQEDIYIERDYSSRNYYIESTDFTKWVEENLSEIEIGNMQGVDDISLYGKATDKLFDFDDPEDEDSIIVNHKKQVIKQTLISNLNQAITSYSKNANGEYSLPILTEEDWEHVFRNISIITFVQNIPIGLKYYNNYAIATSTENKEFVNPNEIYLTRENDSYYHLPYCSQLSDDKPIIGYRNIDYVAKSYNIEKPDGTTDTTYYYKHSNIASEACYYCLVQKDLYTSEGLEDSTRNAHEKAYKIALARERYRNVSEINLKNELDLDIKVSFEANGGNCEIASKLVAYQGEYRGR